MDHGDSSTQAKALEAVRTTAESILEEHDLELIGLTLTRERGRRILRVTLDRKPDPHRDPHDGVSMDQITDVSEEISRALDYDDPIPGSYTLEVASAGLERPLVKPSDYERFVGREIKLRTEEAIEGKRNFQGVIRGAGGETFVLEDQKVVEIPYSSVAKANLVVDWDAELRRAEGRR